MAKTLAVLGDVPGVLDAVAARVDHLAAQRNRILVPGLWPELGIPVMAMPGETGRHCRPGSGCLEPGLRCPLCWKACTTRVVALEGEDAQFLPSHAAVLHA